MTREAEILGLEKGFRASVMTEISRWRAKRGDLNQVQLFAGALGKVRQEYARKIESLRAEKENNSVPISTLIDLTELKIETYYKDEVARAVDTGEVDFDL